MLHILLKTLIILELFLEKMVVMLIFRLDSVPVGRRFSPYKVLDYVNKALIFKQLFMFLDPPVTAFLHMGAKLCFYPMAIKKI